MKEIRAIAAAYSAIDFSATKAALAIVVRTEGSSYRRTGARMLVLDNGTCLGGISGGCLEGDALRRAQKAISLNKPSVVTYDTTEDDARQIGVGLGCNGIIDVLFTPLDPNDPANSAAVLTSITHTRTPQVLVTVTGSTARPGLLGKAWLYQNDDQLRAAIAADELSGPLLPAIQDCLQQQRSQTMSLALPDGSITVFIEVILPAVHLVLYGSNYDIYPVLAIARELGWDLTVVTDTSKARQSLYNTATTVLHHKGAATPVIDACTAVVLMTHDFKTDCQQLPLLLQSPARYIGLLGPRKRMQKIADALAEQGQPIPADKWPSLFAPAGHDIGASSPEEIALSILAEIVAVFAGRQGGPLRQRAVPIHETN
jgi:xanthine/CO dehydrogenase XdhC/CoxF family maturation factor